MTEKILMSFDGDNELDIQFQHNTRFRTDRALESCTENPPKITKHSSSLCYVQLQLL